MERTDIDVLELLPFKVKYLLQGGEKYNLIYTLRLENNKDIYMGETSELLSSKQA